jgi:hypothetical protein
VSKSIYGPIFLIASSTPQIFNMKIRYYSTFLGHVDPTSTAVYLTITADLLQEANKRFERFAAPILKEITL